MAKLTQEMKDMIQTQQFFHATVSTTGIPNNAPRRSTRVLDEIYSLKPGPMAGKRIDNE